MDFARTEFNIACLELGATCPDLMVVCFEGRYRRAHGKPPSGNEVWKFRIGPALQMAEAELYFVGEVMPFKRARLIAQRAAIHLGFLSIEVEP